MHLDYRGCKSPKPNHGSQQDSNPRIGSQHLTHYATAAVAVLQSISLGAWLTYKVVEACVCSLLATSVPLSLSLFPLSLSQWKNMVLL